MQSDPSGSNTFISRAICGGAHYPTRHKRSGQLRSLFFSVIQKLCEAETVVDEVIDAYNTRVRFAYSNINCAGNYFTTHFNGGSGLLVLDLQEFLQHEYQELLKALSTLQLIKTKETDSEFLSRIHLIENKIYDALCSISITLGYQSHEVSIERTTDMCAVSHNTLMRYVRDLELFKLLKRVFRRMFTRIARRGVFLS